MTTLPYTLDPDDPAVDEDAFPVPVPAVEFPEVAADVGEAAASGDA